MALHLAFLLGAVMLIDGSGGVLQHPAGSTRGNELLSMAGKTLGAASMCKEIAASRIDAAADRVSSIVDRTMENDADVASARATFRTGADAGRHAIASGATDCGKADADLRKMEWELKVYAIDR